MNKGLSQVLGLIIAGVVFMTLALTMVALIMDYIPGATEPVGEEACINNLQSYCNAGITHRLPQSCVQDGEIIVSGYGLTEGESVEEWQGPIRCDQFGG